MFFVVFHMLWNSSCFSVSLVGFLLLLFFQDKAMHLGTLQSCLLTYGGGLLFSMLLTSSMFVDFFDLTNFSKNIHDVVFP